MYTALFCLLLMQDSREALGASQGKANGPHPLEWEIREHWGALRAELRNVHPKNGSWRTVERSTLVTAAVTWKAIVT